MKQSKQKRRQSERLQCAELVGIPEDFYQRALTYLFDRPIVEGYAQNEWYWNWDEPEFEATPLEWTRLQTLIYTRCGEDLTRFSDDQVAMGLDYLCSNGIAEVAHAAHLESVPKDVGIAMMRAMSHLWHDCLAKRLDGVVERIGYGRGRLSGVCYMWFDVWPLFWNVRHDADWRLAMWGLLRSILGSANRCVQVSALHGIGHEKHALFMDREIESELDLFLFKIPAKDEELREYAKAARMGMVQ